MSRQLTAITSTAKYARLAVTLSRQLVALVRYDALDVAIAALTRATWLTQITEKAFRTTITTRSTVALFAVACDIVVHHVAAACKVHIRLGTWTRSALIGRIAKVSLGASLAMRTTCMLLAILIEKPSKDLWIIYHLTHTNLKAFSSPTHHAFARLFIAQFTTSIALAWQHRADELLKRTRRLRDISPAKIAVSWILTRCTGKLLVAFA